MLIRTRIIGTLQCVEGNWFYAMSVMIDVYRLFAGTLKPLLLLELEIDGEEPYDMLTFVQYPRQTISTILPRFVNFDE
jgi:hypothetical protein